MSGFEINTVTISGNLTRDPELRRLDSGQAVCNIRIAHNERRKDLGSAADVVEHDSKTVALQA